MGWLWLCYGAPVGVTARDERSQGSHKKQAIHAQAAAHSQHDVEVRGVAVKEEAPKVVHVHLRSVPTGEGGAEGQQCNTPSAHRRDRYS